VKHLICDISEPTDGASSGFYMPVLAPNSAFVADGETSADLLTGVVLHEIVHYITHEMQHTWGDSITAIIKKMKKKSALDLLFKNAFTYAATDQPEELIARTAEFISCKSNNLEVLRKQAPDLLNYYKTSFLKAVTLYQVSLEKKAFKGWSPATFQPKPVNISLGIEEKKESVANKRRRLV